MKLFEMCDKQTQVKEEATGITAEQIRDAWMQEFPNSSVYVGRAFGGGSTFKFRLAKDESEVSSRIMDNDPLNYTALLDKNGNWKEWSSSMFIAPPEGSYLAFGSAKFRKKSAKNVTLPQIQKRFKQVKEFVAQNADKLHQVKFDIGEKLGTGGIKEAYQRPIKTLQKELIVYPNATYDKGQAVRLPVGTEVDFAQGGDNWRQNVAKITANNKVWFAWNNDYLKAIMEPREVKEDEGDIKSKDPKVSQMLKKAKINYAGRADDDLSALVSLMGDEQDVQDHEIDDLDVHNGEQDTEIDQEENTNDSQEAEIGDLQSRVAKLEQKKGVNEDAEEYGVYPTGGSIGSAGTKPYKTFDNKPDAQAYANRMRKQLTRGERGYYKMGYRVKPIKSNKAGINEGESVHLNEGALQNVLNFLWDASGKVLDKMPVIGDKRAEQRVLDEYENFVATMDDATVNDWIDKLTSKLKSSHPASAKASTRRIEIIRKAINKVKTSKNSSDFRQNMRTLHRSLNDLNKFIERSNKGVSNRNRKAGSEVRDFEKSLNDESVNEAGIGKAIKKGAKWLKRGMQGWDSNYADPKDMERKHQEYDTDTLNNLSDFHYNMQNGKAPTHSPHGLQQQLIKRNLRKRGQRDFEKYMNEAEHSEAVNQVLLRLQSAGGKVYDKAHLQKGNETAMLAQNGHIRFAIFQDGTVKRAKKFIEFQRDGWEIEMNLGEAIVPYPKENDEGADYYDDETGEIFRNDQVEQDDEGKMIEKPYKADTSSTDYGVGQYDDDDSLEQWKDNYNKGYEDEPEEPKLDPAKAAQAQGMFGDIAAGGGDPVDHLMMEFGMSMDEIDALAVENGYNDANEWAESYAQTESIIRASRKLNKR